MRISNFGERNHGSAAMFGGSLPPSPGHMGVFPFLLDTKPPHFILDHHLSIMHHFILCLCSPPNPFDLYLPVIHPLQLGILCLYNYIIFWYILRALVIVYYFFVNIFLINVVTPRIFVRHSYISINHILIHHKATTDYAYPRHLTKSSGTPL